MYEDLETLEMEEFEDLELDGLGEYEFEDFEDLEDFEDFEDLDLNLLVEQIVVAYKPRAELENLSLVMAILTFSARRMG